MEHSRDKFPEEKRRVPRIKGALVEYSIDGSRSEKKKAFIKDVCIYGIGIYVPERVMVNAVLDLDIYLFGKDTPVKTKGRVVWEREGGYPGYFSLGIEFFEMDAKNKEDLSNYIANYQEDT